jgi:HEAT repeat protein
MPETNPDETGEPAPDAPEEAPERQTTPFLVLQFFIFPMAIVAVCVTVFIVFGLIASEGKSARDYLSEVRTGGQNRRWQAAFELSKVLQGGKDPALKDPRFVADAVALFQESAKDDPRVRRYLALALGRLGDPAAVPALREAVATAGADADTVIYAAWSLGVLADPAAVPDLVRLAAHEDPGIRKAAAHALGAFAAPEAETALRAALGDVVDDVRWNAALALGRRGDAAATPVLLQMLDRAAVERVQAGAAGAPREVPDAASGDAAEAVLVEAAAVAARSGDPALRGALEALQERDPSMKVREAARRALAHGTTP